jgi:hypothetical protein
VNTLRNNEFRILPRAVYVEVAHGTGHSRSANTARASEVFHQISGGRYAFGGFAHPSGELAGPGDVFRGEDGAQVRDQRLPGSDRKAPGGTHFQSFDPSSPDRLIASRRKDQRGDSSAQAYGRGARATVVHDGAASRKGGRVIDRAHHLDAVRS